MTTKLSGESRSRVLSKSSVQLLGHGQLVTGVCLSPTNPNHVASSSADGTVKVWDISVGGCFTTLGEGDKRVACITYSPDGSKLLSGDWGYLTRVWDLNTGKKVAHLQGHEGKITAARYRPDSACLLTSSEDKTVRTWDVRTGVSVAFAAPDEVLSCCWSTDGLRVLAACKDNSVLLWDARAPEVPTHVLSGHSEWVTCVDISEDGAQILSGSVDRTLKIWDSATGIAIATCEGHEEAVNSCRFIKNVIVSGAGNRFWGSKDNRVLLWELDSGHGEVRRKLLGHTDCVMAVDASAFSNRIAAGSMDRSLRVWDFFLPQRRVERPDPEGPARELCPLGCGERIAQCDASSHASDHCQLREVQCQDCAEKMPARVLAAHAAADCALRRFACVCGDRVLESQRAEHEAALCPLRSTACPFGCGEAFRADRAEQHAVVCQLRTVRCSLGCSASLFACDILDHQQNECPNREVRCGHCGVLVLAKGVKAHQLKHCVRRAVPCTAGCGAQVAAGELALHLRSQCTLRDMPCGLGCGMVLQSCAAVAHEENECLRRLVDCPESCGKRFESQALERHKRECRGKGPLIRTQEQPPLPPTEPASKPPAPLAAAEDRDSQVAGVVLHETACSACGHRCKPCSRFPGPQPNGREHKFTGSGRK